MQTELEITITIEESFLRLQRSEVDQRDGTRFSNTQNHACTGCSLNIVFFSKTPRKFATSPSPALGCYWLYKKLPATRIVLRAFKVSNSDVGEGGVAVNCEKAQFFLNTLYVIDYISVQICHVMNVKGKTLIMLLATATFLLSFKFYQSLSSCCVVFCCNFSTYIIQPDNKCFVQPSEH